MELLNNENINSLKSIISQKCFQQDLNEKFKQDFSSNMPNIFNGPPLNIYPQQQGIGPVGNKSFTQNIPQMLPIINQINTNGNNNNNIPNNLQFGNNQQNNMKSN